MTASWLTMLHFLEWLKKFQVAINGDIIFVMMEGGASLSIENDSNNFQGKYFWRNAGSIFPGQRIPQKHFSNSLVIQYN